MGCNSLRVDGSNTWIIEAVRDDGSCCYSGRGNANDLPLDVQDGPGEGMALDPLPFFHVAEELFGVQLGEEMGDWVGGSIQSSVKQNN